MTPIARAYFTAIIAGFVSIVAASADLFVPAIGLFVVCIVSGLWAEGASA